MKHLAWVGACLGLFAAPLVAEGPAVQSLDFHNVHIRVPDPAKSG